MADNNPSGPGYSNKKQKKKDNKKPQPTQPTITCTIL